MSLGDVPRWGPSFPRVRAPVASRRTRTARSARLVPLLALLALGGLVVAACGGSGGGSTTLRTPQGHYPAGVADGPMIALPTPTSVVIRWDTTSAVEGAVEYGPTPAYGTTVTGPSDTRHEVALTGLSPHATYHYRLLDGGTPAGDDHTFSTPPADATTPVRFAVEGDSGTGGAHEDAIVARVEGMGPEFVLDTGDVAYLDGSVTAVHSRYVVPFAPLMDHVPVFATWGNHDVMTDGGQPLADAVTQPTNPVDGGERFYSFDWGMAHVACLDSNDSLAQGGAQRAWLDADLSASTAPWKFVFFHHPVYSSSTHGSTPGLAESLGPVLDAHRVAAVFNGHDHDYERTHPMYAGAPTDTSGGPDYVNPTGTFYVVTGGGGMELYPAGTGTSTARSESVYHAVQVDLTATKMTMKAVREDGSTIETVTVTRAP